MTKRVNHKRYDSMEQPGFVIERDNHFTVNRLPVIDRGPVECFAWRLYDCHPNKRQDYMLQHMGFIKRSYEFDFIDLEITHYRLLSTPPEDWVQGMPNWPDASPINLETAA